MMILPTTKENDMIRNIRSIDDITEDRLNELIAGTENFRLGIATRITKMATNVSAAEDLLQDVQRLATLEAEVFVFATAVNLLKNYDGDLLKLEKAQFQLLKLTLRPVDDVWSGRGNDLARVKFAAMQLTVEILVDALDR
jgi:hypothetical protein